MDRLLGATASRRAALMSIVSMALLAGGCIGRPADPSAAALDDVNIRATAASVTLDVTQQYQTLEGFGASVAWYLDRITGAPQPGLYELLFPELGLDILRFRNRFERSDAGDGRLEEEVEIFERATEALGFAPKLLLTSWSPPARLKENGAERCNSNPNCTLKKEGGKFVYEEFAQWWLDSVEHYKSVGLNPTYVSMQNEPSFLPPDWEGCKFEAEETAAYPGYGKALEAVHAKLSTLPERPKILGPEVLGVHYKRVQKYLAGLNPDLLDGVAHHLYEKGDDDVWDWRDPGPDSFVPEMRGVAEATNKPMYQTEFNTDEDGGAEGGFETAWLIHHSLVEQGVVAFLYWDLIWVDNKGLVTMKGRTPQPRDHYYSLRHYARYTDPGYVRVAAQSSASELLASAYVAPDRSRLSAIVLNTGTAPLQVNLTALAFESSRKEVYRTTFRPGRSKQWERLEFDSDETVRLPGRSVATIVLFAGDPPAERHAAQRSVTSE